MRPDNQIIPRRPRQPRPTPSPEAPRAGIIRNTGSVLLVLICLGAIGLSFFGGKLVYEMARPPTPEEARVEARKEAETLADVNCMLAVRKSATHKAEFRLAFPSVELVKDGKHYWFASGYVDLMNRFGAMILHEYYCAVTTARAWSKYSSNKTDTRFTGARSPERPLTHAISPPSRRPSV